MAKILVTGAGGTIGRGLVSPLEAAGHELVVTDLAAPYRVVDVRDGAGLDAAAEGCDLLIHLPAWHGIHRAVRSDEEFWQLNVQGTFRALEAAQRAGIRRVVYLSSQAWHDDRYGKYGFTKRVAEELLEYRRRAHGVSYVSVRPGNLTPWGDDWPGEYGRGLLYGRVDREDVLAAIVASVAFLQSTDAGVALDVVRPNPDPLDALERWASDPVGTAEQLYPGAREVIERFGLDVTAQPRISPTGGWAEIGYRPAHDFGTFVAEALRMSESEARALRCPY
ncbi:MAG: NAD(P)-dependent oxidoreductase [Salinibacterium sp.]|nr:NAD(P)-dependent oxidoreductase [Salinibacterium sp.]